MQECKIIQDILVLVSLWGVYHVILDGWRMERLDLNHLNSFFKVAWIFDNKFVFSKHSLTWLLKWCSQIAQCVWFLTKALNLPFFILLLMMAISGAQGKVEDIRHTCITEYCIVKNRIQEENYSYNLIKMCKCMKSGWYGNMYTFLYVLSPFEL
jgi:hypothetical protein